MKNKSSLLIFLCIAAAVLIAGGGVYYWLYGSSPEEVLPPPIVEELPEPEPEPEPEPIPEREPLVAWPVRMYIPALGVDAEIQDTGSDSQGAMHIVPSADIISWFRGAAIPGNDGNCFLAGHNRWGGKDGSLIEMDVLNIGDEMDIEYADGTRLKFMLESVFVYALATAPAHLIMNAEGEARVTVITCKGPFNTAIGTSDYRIVAIFKEDRVFEIPDPPIEPFPPME